MFGSNVARLRLLKSSPTLRLSGLLTQSAIVTLRTALIARSNSTVTSPTEQIPSPAAATATKSKSRPNFRQNRRPRLSIEQRAALESKYAEIDELLKKNKTAEASALFVETYDPESSYVLRYFREEERSNRLYIKLFNKVLQAHQRGQDEGVIPLRDLFIKYLEGKLLFGWMCSEVILFEVFKGRTNQGLEVWVKFWEALGDVTRVRELDNREAALAAMIAYIGNCISENSQPVSKIALYLVPLETVPDDSEIHNLFRSSSYRFDQGLINSVLEGLRAIRLEALNPADVDFLNSLPVDRPLELEHRYAECKRHALTSGSPLPESTYARFIFCFAESGRTQQAFDIWNDLTQSGIVPSVQSWNMLLKAAALSKEQSVVVTEAIISKMEQAGISPNADSYGTLIDIYFKSGRPETAMEIFEKIQKGEIDVTTNLKIFNVMLNGLLNAGFDKMARDLLDEGIQQGLSPDVIAFNTFIKTFLKQKRYSEVEAMLTLMSDNGVTPNVATYTNVIDSMYKSANQKNINPENYVGDLVKDMNSNGIRTNTSTITAIIDGLAKSGSGTKAAHDLYELMKRKRLRPNLRTFTALINGEILAGNMNQAVEYFGQMRQFNIIRPTASYNQMIHGFANRGLISQCMDYFRLAVADSRSPLNRYTYAFVLQGCVNARDWDSAREVLKELNKEPKNFHPGRPLLKLLNTLSIEGIKVPSFQARLNEENEQEQEQGEVKTARIN